MAAPTKKKHSAKNRKTKTLLEFNDKARSEYLRGFQKRKNERRKVAMEKNDKRLIEERKAIKKQFREQKNRKTEESDIIPEIKHLIDPKVYNLPDHTVTIADFGDVDFVGDSGIRLGKNKCSEEDDSGEKKDSTSENTPAVENLSCKSFQKKLGVCSNQLSSSKLKAKKANKRQHFRSKKKMQKKGKGGKKGGKKQ